MLEGKAITEAIRAAFAEQPHGVSYALTRNLGALFPGAFLLATEDSDFAIEHFAHAGHCRLSAIDGVTNEASYSWHDRLYRNMIVTAWALDWAGHPGEPLHCVTAGWGGDCRREVRFVMAPRPEVAEKFFTAVCRWNRDLSGSVLVFDRGSWGKNKELYTDIARTRVEDLVLPAALRDEIVGDLQRSSTARPSTTASRCRGSAACC